MLKTAVFLKINEFYSFLTTNTRKSVALGGVQTHTSCSPGKHPNHLDTPTLLASPCINFYPRPYFHYLFSIYKATEKCLVTDGRCHRADVQMSLDRCTEQLQLKVKVSEI